MDFKLEDAPNPVSDATRGQPASGGDVTPVRHIEDGAWVDGPGVPWNNFDFFGDPGSNGLVLQERPKS